MAVSYLKENILTVIETIVIKKCNDHHFPNWLRLMNFSLAVVRQLLCFHIVDFQLLSLSPCLITCNNCLNRYRTAYNIAFDRLHNATCFFIYFVTSKYGTQNTKSKILCVLPVDISMNLTFCFTVSDLSSCNITHTLLILMGILAINGLYHVE